MKKKYNKCDIYKIIKMRKVENLDTLLILDVVSKSNQLLRRQTFLSNWQAGPTRREYGTRDATKASSTNPKSASPPTRATQPATDETRHGQTEERGKPVRESQRHEGRRDVDRGEWRRHGPVHRFLGGG